jgi:hypothetical protein
VSPAAKAGVSSIAKYADSSSTGGYNDTSWNRTDFLELEFQRLDLLVPWLLKQAGIKPSTWNSWEKFGRIPPADRALMIADALGV